MTFAARVILMYVVVVALVIPALWYGLDRTLHRSLLSSQLEWAETLTDTLRLALSRDVIDGRKLEVKEKLQHIVERDAGIDYAYIVDFDDRLFVHTFAKGFPRALDKHEHPQASESDRLHVTYGLPEHRNSDLSMYLTPAGKYIYDFSLPLIEGLPGYLHLGINETEISAAIREARLIIVAILGLAALGMVILGGVMGRRISRPLELLTEQVRRYGEGKPVALESVHQGGPEVRTLRDVLQQMMRDRARQIVQLEEREQYLVKTLDSIGDGVIATDKQGTVTRLNPVARDLTGWAAADVVGRPLREIFHIVNAFSREPVEDPVEKVLATGKIVGLANHTVLIARDGTEYQIADSGAPILDGDGRILGVILVFRDVTEEYRMQARLRESEAHFRHLAESTTAVPWKQEPGTCRFSYVGPQVEEVLGYSQAEWCEPDFWTRHLHPDDREAAVQTCRENVRTLHDFELEYRMLAAHERVVWIRQTVSVVEENDSPVLLQGYLFDITERKLAEMELEQYRNDLETLVRERTRELESFSYSVSHDLRAPLRAIDGFGLVLAEDYGSKLDDKGLGYLQRVRKAAQRMGNLIDGLLTLSKVTRTDLSPTTVNLSDLCHDIVRQLHDSDPERRVEWQVESDLRVVADKNLLDIVCTNLLGNAWKYTAQEAQARIEVGHRETEGGVVYHVRDNGVGFDSQRAGKLFTPFQRLHDASDFEGTGIGLATVQRIVSRHGGRVWAEATPGAGATFYFTLAGSIPRLPPLGIRHGPSSPPEH